MTFIQPAASHFINGRYVDDTNGPELELIYPANGQPLGQLHAATPAIVEEALPEQNRPKKPGRPPVAPNAGVFCAGQLI